MPVHRPSGTQRLKAPEKFRALGKTLAVWGRMPHAGLNSREFRIQPSAGLVLQFHTETETTREEEVVHVRALANVEVCGATDWIEHGVIVDVFLRP